MRQEEEGEAQHGEVSEKETSNNHVTERVEKRMSGQRRTNEGKLLLVSLEVGRM